MKRIILTFFHLLLFFSLVFSQSQTFSNPGTYSFTIPAGVTSITIQAWGGGGGGGTQSGNTNSKGGGGGGGYVTNTYTVTPGTLYSNAFVVGSGGGIGASGNSSSYNITGTVTAGGGGAPADANQNNGGPGGTISGSFGTGSSVGGAGGQRRNNQGGGGGGGSGSTPTAGSQPPNNGTGGAAGTPGGGAGGADGSPGQNGQAAGGGGGGRGDGGGTSGTGANGQIIITYTCPTLSISGTTTITCPSPSPVTFTSSVSGATSYQWQRNSGSGWVDITSSTLDDMMFSPATYSGFNSAALTITTAHSAINGYQYRVVTTNTGCPGSTSNILTLTVNSCPLPITLADFKAKQVDNTITLKWSTASEHQNDHIDVERSKDGVHFVKIGQRKGFGTTNEPKQYEWTDLLPMPGINYYRLKQVDYDGKFEYHKVIAVEFNGKSAQTGIRLYPTEVRDQVQVVLDQPITDNTILYVLDMSGRILQKQKIAVGASQHELSLNTLPAGMYVISLQSNKTVQTARFVKL